MYAVCYTTTNSVHPGTERNPVFEPEVVFIGPKAHIHFRNQRVRYSNEESAVQHAEAMAKKIDTIVRAILRDEGYGEYHD